ncbi:hypothetical protein BH11BAC3_BH11BAC3_47680 [soil metagenome]
MGKSDQWVIITLAISIVLHLSVCTIGYFAGRQSYWMSFLNLLFGSTLIVYWGMRELKIVQHYIELREIGVLSFEILVITGAVYFIVTGSKANWISVLQKVFFLIHLIVLIAGLIFMYIFKMNKMI